MRIILESMPSAIGRWAGQARPRRIPTADRDGGWVNERGVVLGIPDLLAYGGSTNCTTSECSRAGPRRRFPPPRDVPSPEDLTGTAT